MTDTVMAVKFDHIVYHVFVPCTAGPHAFAFQRECGGEPLFRLDADGGRVEGMTWYIPGIGGAFRKLDRLNYRVWWIGPIRKPLLSVHRDERGGVSICSLGRCRYSRLAA